MELTPDEIREDVVFALVDEGYLPANARVAVNMSRSGLSFSDLYREALGKIRPEKSSAKNLAQAGNSVSKGGRGDSPEPSAAVPSRAAAFETSPAPLGPEPKTGEKRMAHQCPCGAPLHAKAIALGKCKACRTASNGEPVPHKKPAKSRTSSPKPESSDELRATLQFTESQLDSFFLNSSLEQKAECIQTWLANSAL